MPPFIMKTYTTIDCFTHEITSFRFLINLCNHHNIHYKNFLKYKKDKNYPILKDSIMIYQTELLDVNP